MNKTAVQERMIHDPLYLQMNQWATKENWKMAADSGYQLLRVYGLTSLVERQLYTTAFESTSKTWLYRTIVKQIHAFLGETTKKTDDV